ncbi:alpha beta hydrolase domain-containing protein [Gyrodon lividus]|nr:alpha beta hydrolase domain-containing protein [Gyrodon lividus]
MDVIKTFKDTSIDKVNFPTLAAFIPILNEKKAEIEKVEKKEFKYGQRYRHNLDVYYPPSSSVTTTPNGKLPVLFFIYGGGYNTGARQFQEPYEMGYRALGAFFAQRGFATVIPDYRLVPEVKYPAASEDIRDALVWVSQNAPAIAAGADFASSCALEPDPEYMFVMGHSAGAAHTMVMALHAGIRGSVPRLRGLVLSGGPWFFSVDGEKFTTEGPVKFYFGAGEVQRQREPRALWKELEDEDVRGLPDVLLMQAENEPGWLKEQTREIMAREIGERLRGVGREMREMLIAKGHNHVSVNWVLGTGDEVGERWGYDVVEWIKQRIVPQ